MGKINLDARRTVPEIIMHAGYNIEIHKIKTEDDYINTVWRIPGKMGSNDAAKPYQKPPVIVQHGFTDNSALWLFLNESTGLPFVLSDAGYDVWITNARGNIYSYEHMDIENFDSHKRNGKFFQFSWDEMAKYDIPSYIDYIIERSDYNKVSYIGISQGTTSFFAACDLFPGIENKIATYVAYAPVTYLGNVISPFVRALSGLHLLNILEYFGQYNFLMTPEHTSWINVYVGAKFKRTLVRVLQLVMGITDEIITDMDRIPVFLNRQPGGTSLFDVKHWTQAIESGEFQMYDFGPKGNMEHYEQETAPLYNMEHIAEVISKIPTKIFVGGNDAFVVPKDFAKLEKVLEGTGADIVKIDHYNHADYITSTSCKEVVFDPTLEFMKQHINNYS